MRGCDVEKQWYECRDFLLGSNYKPLDVKKALSLAASCPHPDALLLCSVLAGVDTSCVWKVREALGRCGDPRALCFAALMRKNVDKDALQMAAECGSALAQARLCMYKKGLEKYALALGKRKRNNRNVSFLSLMALGRCSKSWRARRLLCTCSMLYLRRWS